jgi:penicillin-binding protein 1A
MSKAVATRPVEQFQTTVEAPDWAEPDEEVWFKAPSDQAPLVDSEGNPVERPAAPIQSQRPEPEDEDEVPPQADELNREWLDRAVNPDRAPRRELPPRRREREPAADRPRERQEF